MELILNLCSSDEVGGTSIFHHNGTELRAHWSEGYSPVIITDKGGKVLGHINEDMQTATDPVFLEMVDPLSEHDPKEGQRLMTQEEELAFETARNTRL